MGIIPHASHQEECPGLPPYTLEAFGYVPGPEMADVLDLRDLPLIRLEQRLQVAEMLEAGNTFSQISKEIGVSSATITRVNKCISYGADGYKIVLKRMKEKNAHE